MPETDVTIDPANPVAALCAEGMRAEAEGRPGDARALFGRAWDAAADDYEACLAAHYVARHQTTPGDRLRWNAECLDRADRAGDDRVRAFYPSLHLNLARAHADLGDPAAARDHYRRAADRLDALPPGPYRDWVVYAVAAGLREPGPDPVRDLIDRLCDRRAHGPLALLLPRYAAAPLAPDRTDLVTALHMVHASPDLDDRTRDLVRAAIGTG
jgi:tetratricopeptide (TPR) repeat protein